MPIEVRELVIRAVVAEREIRPAPGEASRPPEPAKIIEDCIEQILQILKERAER